MKPIETNGWRKPDGEYLVELTWCGRRKKVTFRTRQNKDGSWYATGLGCSRDYPVEMEAIQALIDAECCTDLVWL